MAVSPVALPKRGPDVRGREAQEDPERKGGTWPAESFWQPLLPLLSCSWCKVSRETVPATPGSTPSHPFSAACSPPLRITRLKNGILPKLCTKTAFFFLSFFKLGKHKQNQTVHPNHSPCFAQFTIVKIYNSSHSGNLLSWKDLELFFLTKMVLEISLLFMSLISWPLGCISGQKDKRPQSLIWEALSLGTWTSFAPRTHKARG